MEIPFAPELGADINTSQIYSGLWENLPPVIMEKIDFILNLGIWLLGAGIAYFIVLFLIKIIGFFSGLRKEKNIRKISDNLEITNKRLEEISGLLGKKRGGKEIKKFSR